ncbi:hypothetical protein KFK09_018793 [Dendrobium nobile]|uniref:RING-type E3 ubiquitin transferase n=1 Tax=Dendrobium nobile TaxID=94219 RepID=A0A8T3AW99_DENNO|nr:hypothetical protein KFK09_018793 [Dendrobium nobile]
MIYCLKCISWYSKICIEDCVLICMTLNSYILISVFLMYHYSHIIYPIGNLGITTRSPLSLLSLSLSLCLSLKTMNADFVSGDASIPTSSTTTSIDYHSPIGFTVLVSVVALFIICSFVVFAQNCFANQHHDQATTTPAYTRPRVSVAVPPSPGLDAAAVAALPVVRYNGGGGEGCAVCLVEYGVKEMVKVIPGCGHGFHSECIDTWLIWRGSCPVCRCSELRGPSSGEVCVGVFGCGEGNLGGKMRSMSGGRCCSKAEAGGPAGEMFLRRTCSV